MIILKQKGIVIRWYPDLSFVSVARFNEKGEEENTFNEFKNVKSLEQAITIAKEATEK